jgi:hypothetical protein
LATNKNKKIPFTVLKETHKAVPLADGKFRRKIVTFWDQGQGENAPSNRFVILDGEWIDAFRPGRTYKMNFERWMVRRPVLCPLCATLSGDLVEDDVYW